MNYSADAATTLARLRDDIMLDTLSGADASTFDARLDKHFPALFAHFTAIYGHQSDCYWHLRNLIISLRDGFAARTGVLKKQDKQSLKNPLWYRSEEQVGMACYVDLMGPSLKGLQQRIPYLNKLGITYLHLMPLYAAPEGDSDGGYAVSDYRTVNPSLGTMSALRSLSKALHEAGIRLVLDFVFNHTSDEHQWAQAALAGDPDYQNYYYLFDDRTEPDKYEQHLREIFPQVRRGSFTFNEHMQKWVWTTFNSFQWDLNYANPQVFNAITNEMLFLANVGCDALRLDALAFIWKEQGTDCENRPLAHTLIQAFNSCLQIAAPSVVFKSEAIVHPDEVVKYIHRDECQLSYNPLLMALLWNSLATRKTRLLTRSMQKSFTIASDCTWVNYVRCHDDIGWTFDDAVAWDLGINPHDHRFFLNQYFTGRFEGSFAKGVPFAENPTNGDCRVCGSLASLCGLESALANNDEDAASLALKRMQLLYGIIFAIGGIPLIYAGDELALLNDYSYRAQADKKHDDRWVHRIATTDAHIALAMGERQPASMRESTQLAMFQAMQKLVSLRREIPVTGAARTHIIDTGNPHCFAFLRHDHQGRRLLVTANFSEHQQTVNKEIWANLDHREAEDKMSGDRVSGKDLQLSPYQLCWFTCL